MPRNYWYWVLIATLITFCVFFCVGCGHLQQMDNRQALGGGFVTGAAAKGLADKAVDATKADIKLPNPSLEMCWKTIPDDDVATWHENLRQTMESSEDYEDLDFNLLADIFGIQVTCVISPCPEPYDACHRQEPWSEYSERNGGRFSSIEVNSMNVEKYLDICKLDKELCRDVLYRYEGKNILVNIVDDE